MEGPVAGRCSEINWSMRREPQNQMTWSSSLAVVKSVINLFFCTTFLISCSTKIILDPRKEDIQPTEHLDGCRNRFWKLSLQLKKRKISLVILHIVNVFRNCTFVISNKVYTESEILLCHITHNKAKIISIYIYCFLENCVQKTEQRKRIILLQILRFTN